MRLRYQLLLAGAVTLILPVVAYRAVQQMDIALGEARAYELLQRTDSSKTLLAHSGLLSELGSEVDEYNNRDLYAERVHHRMVLDGYDDDWINNRLPVRRFKYGDNKSTNVRAGGRRLAVVDVRLSVSNAQLHLFIEVIDDNVIYHDPTRGKLAAGDHVAVFVEDRDGNIDSATFRAVAPGPIFAVQYGQRVDGLRPIRRLQQYRGFWTATNNGYQLEIDVPLPPAGSRFGFAVVDNDKSRSLSQDAWMGTADPANPDTLGRLVYQSSSIENLLSDIVPPGSRARVYDLQGWLRADINKLYEKPANQAQLNPATANFFNALLYRFFEWVVTARQRTLRANFPLVNQFSLDMDALPPAANTTNDAPWFATDTRSVRRYFNLDRDQIMGRLTPAGGPEGDQAFLLFETNEDSANAFTSSAMVRLFSQVTLLSLLVAGSLLIFATWLSWRIRQLTRQARSAVGRDGKHLRAVKASTATDEIGELSRSFARLVERSAGYTQYLESLASKLSHELRTPLSVVKTSLENVDDTRLDSDARQLLRRAQGGADQLSTLIRSMSEATRLEQAVQHSEFTRFLPEPWLNNAQDSYRSIYPAREFELVYKTPVKSLQAVPELLQQALDKLVANAVDFSAEGGVIQIIANGDAQRFDLSVVNRGAQIVEAQSDQLFEPMFSARAAPGPDAHLGLGLYIVRLISEAHHGRAWARNRGTDAVQVGFSIRPDRDR